MTQRTSIHHVALALGFAALSSLLAPAISSADTLDQVPSNPQVRIETPSSGARVHGAVTFTGLAVDCGSGQPASNVSVYDGNNSSGTYLADVSLDTTRSHSDLCAGRTGSSQSGFTLIFDSTRLSEGRHTLAFVARFPGGTLQTTTTDVNVDNVLDGRVTRFPAYYSGVYNGGYWANNVYTPVYTRCTAWNTLGGCVAYTNVAAPVVTPSVYPGCVTNVYGQCVSYPYTTNPYYVNTYLTNQYVWNGYTWVLR